MSFLLDTNVLSEIRRPQPDQQVLAWLDQADEDRTYLSVITIAEIARGVALMDEGRRRTDLAQWLELDLPARFGSRILPVDVQTALTWGNLLASTRKEGIALSVMDGWIAATAITRQLTLVTRNTKDFQNLPLTLLDPWSPPAA
ncbi:Ribonuclease VapC [Devosia sp. LC5]|uniref:type II toxin-antitoxin system VapC family toxin n=1 Tax=Devosia sp. LC5 TaxID=1502724 RepID=UPI0004E2E8AE|nr:type II toxin-antitoxin system VapC family toxin [Devosia sp. LC5]KFC61998.1 Ribonuclease VapC [Devosia sp. LC5]